MKHIFPSAVLYGTFGERGARFNMWYPFAELEPVMRSERIVSINKDVGAMLCSPCTTGLNSAF